MSNTQVERPEPLLSVGSGKATAVLPEYFVNQNWHDEEKEERLQAHEDD